ncbi:MAG: transcriptional regulator MraZ [Proteobacteria bacterium]|nr:MAG: transcriptional regulator MraZ [Pseudomonadota bacterium]
MFRGASTLNMDSKGRIAIPARYRDEILGRSGGNLVLTVNNTKDRCLWLFTLDEWERAEQKLVALPSFDKSAQYLKRLLIGYANDCEMDAAGRMRISSPLIEFAGLDKHVVLIGQGNKFELWDEAEWKRKYEEWLAEPVPEGPVSEHLADLSL